MIRRSLQRTETLRRALWLALLVLLPSAAGAQSLTDALGGGFSPGATSAAEDAPHARAALIADTTAIQPGVPFRLGVRFEMDPGWHIYWSVNGDTGYPTEIVWELPEGFEVGPLQWPAPERAEFAGMINYGYHDEVLLFATVTPPADLDGETVRLAARPDWLVCSDTCIPGNQHVELTLPVATAAPSPEAPLFDHYAARVPEPLDALRAEDPDLPLKWNAPSERIELAGGQRATVDIAIDVAAPWTIDVATTGQQAAGVYPLVPGDWEVTHPELTELTDSRLAVSWPVEPRPQATASPEGERPVQAVVRLPLVNRETGDSRLVVFRHPIEVAVAGTPAQSTGAPSPENAQPDAISTAETDTSAAGELTFLRPSDAVAPQAAGGLWWNLLLAFLGGVILNVMPCVLPVISLKVMGFVRQSGEDPGRVFRMGLVYGLGVLVSFGALAAAVVVAKVVFGLESGWGTQMQEPRFVIIMAAVVLAFALSLFGVFTVELPGTATNRLAESASGEGYGGSFMNGVLATALATPCSAPLLAPATGYAFSQPTWMIPVFFLTIGLGLALPYVLLAANPRLLRFLPKPGAWMETVKQFMGFALIGMLVWLMWILGSLVGTAGMTLTLAFLATVAFGCWLLGLRWESMSISARRRRTLTAAAAIVMIGGYTIFPEFYLQAVAMPDGGPEQTSAPAATDAGGYVSASGEILWQPFSVSFVEDLVADGRTVFLDFTADWCITCKFNENTVLSTGRVADAFRRHDVVPVKVDWTRRDDTIRRILGQFGAAGVPLYVILPAGRADEPIVLPTLLNPGLVEEKLEEAAAMRLASGI